MSDSFIAIPLDFYPTRLYHPAVNFAKFSRLTRLEQTLFSLPFLLVALLSSLATLHFHPDGWGRLLLIFPPFLAARLSGMAFNQFIDAAIDAKNPRTANRVIPMGEVSALSAFKIAWGMLFFFLLSSFFLGKMVFFLALGASVLIALYSYVKQFHCSCHFVLGMIHCLVPVIGWCAVTGKIAVPAVFLGLSQLFLVAGSDILYAFGDLAFDLREHLHSIPARLGVGPALALAKSCHGVALVSLTLFGLTASLGPLFFLAPSLSTIFFILFYKKRRESVLSCNLFLSLSVFVFTTLDVLWRAM